MVLSVLRRRSLVTPIDWKMSSPLNGDCDFSSRQSLVTLIDWKQQLGMLAKRDQPTITDDNPW